MKDVTPDIARGIVLRHLPRALRAGLDADATDGPLPAQLAADAGPLHSALCGRVFVASFRTSPA